MRAKQVKTIKTTNKETFKSKSLFAAHSVKTPNNLQTILSVTKVQCCSGQTELMKRK